MGNRYEIILNKLKELPVLDVHSHINVDCPQASSIEDIIFYHFIRRELYSAGYSDDNYLMSDTPIEDRMSTFFQYLPQVENTATFWCVKKILGDLYQVPGGEITQQNWRNIQQKIERNKTDPSWLQEVIKRCQLERSLCCEKLWKKESLERHPFLTPLYEDLNRLSFDPTRATSLDDLIIDVYGLIPDNIFSLEEYIYKYINDSIMDNISYFTAFISSEFRIDKNSSAKTNDIYKKKHSGKKLTVEERNILVNKLLYCYLSALQSFGVPAQFVIGAYWAREGMRYGESYVETNHTFIKDLVVICKEFNQVRFSLMYASHALSQEVTILSRMLPNVSILGFWWHTLFPTFIERIIFERLEALPANKWIAIATDSYCIEWAYAKLNLVLHSLAKVLCEKIDEGYFTEKKALWIAHKILYQNSKDIYEL